MPDFESGAFDHSAISPWSFVLRVTATGNGQFYMQVTASA